MSCPLGHEKDPGQPCSDCASLWQAWVSKVTKSDEPEVAVMGAGSSKADDFPSRLRACGYASGDEVVAGMCNSAADRIERLQRAIRENVRDADEIRCLLAGAPERVQELEREVADLEAENSNLQIRLEQANAE